MIPIFLSNGISKLFLKLLSVSDFDKIPPKELKIFGIIKSILSSQNELVQHFYSGFLFCLRPRHPPLHLFISGKIYKNCFTLDFMMFDPWLNLNFVYTLRIRKGVREKAKVCN